MPFRKIGRVKLAAVNLHERNLLSLEQTFECVGFSESTFWHILKLWRETGDVVRHNYLIRLVNHRLDWFLGELLGLLEDNTSISVHFTTIYRELLRVGISLKKIVRERDEGHHADFIWRMAQYEQNWGSWMKLRRTRGQLLDTMAGRQQGNVLCETKCLGIHPVSPRLFLCRC